MSIFQNSFFSLSGQKERLDNVKNTLISAVTGKVQSNTGIKPVDTVLSTAASHPFITATALWGGATPMGNKVASTVGTKIASSYAQAGIVTQVAVPATGIVVGSALLNSPKLANKVLDTPSALSNFGANVGKFAEEPTVANAKSIATGNPIITGAVATVGAVAVGSAVTGAYTTYANTKAVRENTQASMGNVTSQPEFTTVMKNLSNGHDEDIAEGQAKASIAIAKLQSDLAEKQLKAETSIREKELELQEKQLSMPVPVVATPTPVVKTTTKRKVTKRKKKVTKKKKKKVTKKRKVYKRKSKRKRKR